MTSGPSRGDSRTRSANPSWSDARLGRRRRSFGPDTLREMRSAVAILAMGSRAGKGGCTRGTCASAAYIHDWHRAYVHSAESGRANFRHAPFNARRESIEPPQITRSRAKFFQRGRLNVKATTWRTRVSATPDSESNQSGGLSGTIQPELGELCLLLTNASKQRAGEQPHWPKASNNQ